MAFAHKHLLARHKQLHSAAPKPKTAKTKAIEDPANVVNLLSGSGLEPLTLEEQAAVAAAHSALFDTEHQA